MQYSGNTNIYFYNNIIHTFETYFSKRDTLLAGVKVGSADGKVNSYLFNNTIAPSYKAGNVGRHYFQSFTECGYYGF